MPDAPREVFLIDGNSLAYRAFFALPDHRYPRGEPTNAIFGFASMLVKILTEYGPRSTVVVWDGGLSGREGALLGLQGPAPAAPRPAGRAVAALAPLVEAFGYTNLKVPGYEADDVIATLAREARTRDLDVMVVTGDRDAFQLVEPGRARDGH